MIKEKFLTTAFIIVNICFFVVYFYYWIKSMQGGFFAEGFFYLVKVWPFLVLMIGLFLISLFKKFPKETILILVGIIIQFLALNQPGSSSQPIASAGVLLVTFVLKKKRII